MKIAIKKPTSLLEALVENDASLSRSRVRKWLKEERIAVNKKLVTRDTNLDIGDEITLFSKKKHIQGLLVHYKDEHIIIIEKPRGLLSVSTEQQTSDNALSLLRREFPGIVPAHRLDRETSGILLFALNKKAKENLVPQFKDHTILREYVAVLEGHLESPKGTWKSHLKDDKRFVVRSDPTGDLAITHFQTLKKTKRFTFVLCRLETGKKNQIRVHASESGHPVVGDEKYGSTQDPFGRMALHAQRLEFKHPISGKKMRFLSPNPFE